jgi:hypothetical protein
MFHKYHIVLLIIMILVGLAGAQEDLSKLIGHGGNFGIGL